VKEMLELLNKIIKQQESENKEETIIDASNHQFIPDEDDLTYCT
jgi:hypothetical protein